MAVEVTQEIDIALLKPHPHNIEIYGEEDVTELVDYIRDSKWIKPLVIDQHNQIISGHRRWQAAPLAGFTKVPYVRQYFETEEDALKALLLENASRDKTPEQRVNEAEAWGWLEKREADKRRALNGGDKYNSEPHRENFPTPVENGRVRDKLAERVGFGSGKTYENAAKVVNTAKQLKEEGKTEEGQALLKVLNEQSVNAATRVLSMPEPQKEAVLQTIASGKASTVKQAEAVIKQEAPPNEVEEEDDDDYSRTLEKELEIKRLMRKGEIPLLPFQEAARQELAQEKEEQGNDTPDIKEALQPWPRPHLSERAIAYAEEIKQRAEDAWFKERGLDKEQPEAQEALRVFIEQNAEEDDDNEDDEEDLRYDGDNAAYCKYCYKTHKKWRLDEDAWLCEFCYHCTPDEFMQIEDVEESEDQKEFYRRHSVPTALLSSESNEWFTPSQYVEKARELMGGIDLDPASNAYANEKVVQAISYYDIQTNGLDKEWHGRVWLNPPYGRDERGSNQEAWSRRLIEQYEAGITKEAVLLVNANTEAKWFQPLYNYLICFTNHRIRFYNTEGTPNQPTQGNAFIYFGNHPERFTELFSAFGVIIRRIDK